MSRLVFWIIALAVVSLSATPAFAGTEVASEVDELTGIEKATIRTMEFATACWFLAVGCSVGSFLNVVAYRLPAGMSLGKPKSHCPHCKTPLGRRENLPVLGWLLLRGRCRHCSVPISPRYPLVEAIVGALFVLLLFVELLSGGKNLPVRVPNSFAGVVWIVWYTKWDLVGLYLFHCCLLCVMTAIGLMAIDHNRVPRSLVLWSVGIGIALPTVWPTLHPVPFVVPHPAWVTPFDWRYEWTDQIFSFGWKQSVGLSLAGLLDSMIGLVAGLLCGVVSAIPERDQRTRHNVRSTFAIVGTFLGWQAVLSVAAAATLVNAARLAVRRFGNRSGVPTPCIVGLLTLAQILAWRWLASVDFWTSHRGLPVLPWPEDSTMQLIGLLLLLVALNLVLRRFGGLAATYPIGPADAGGPNDMPDPTTAPTVDQAPDTELSSQ